MIEKNLLLKNYNRKLYRRLTELSCSFVKAVEIEPSEILVDQGIYPREKTDSDRIEIYREDILKGDRFPPVIVTEKDGKLLLVDGNHRYFAHLQAGTKVPVEIWEIPPHKIEYVATICNVLGRGKAGKDLTGSEKKKEIIKAYKEGINTSIESLAHDFETSVSYVRKVLSQAGLIRDRKEEMKKRARELREEGYSVREIAKKLSEESGEEISYRSVARWLEENVTKFTQVKNVTPTPTVHSILDDPETLTEEEEPLYDLPVEEIEKKIEEAKRLIERGYTPIEAWNAVSLPPERDWWGRAEYMGKLIQYHTDLQKGKKNEQKQKEKKPKKLKTKEEIKEEVVSIIQCQLARLEHYEGREGVIELLEWLLSTWKSGKYKKEDTYRVGKACFEVEYLRI